MLIDLAPTPPVVAAILNTIAFAIVLVYLCDVLGLTRGNNDE